MNSIRNWSYLGEACNIKKRAELALATLDGYVGGGHTAP